MAITKYFIRKRNKFRPQAILPALLLMSAFAIFMPTPVRGTDKKEEMRAEASDSIFTARRVFEKIQASALEILPESTRLDMLDYWDIDSIYKASNVMDGLSWIEKLTPSYMRVRVTPVSTLEIKILPSKTGKLAMTIHTVGDETQAEDSQIKFYDENLKELPEDRYLVLPQLKDFFNIPKGSATSMKEIQEMIPFPTVSFSANPDNTDLSARLTVEKYINEDDWNIARLFVKPQIILEWKKDKYKFK